MAKTTETTHADVPAGQGATSAKTFELIPPEQRKLDLRRTDGRAEVTYTLENKRFHPVRGRLEIEPSGATQAEWLTVAGERNRDFRSREVQDFRVRIAIPPDTPANAFEFTAMGINEANPDEDFTERERSSITIDWEPVPIVKRISKWKLALMILAPLLVLGAGGALLYRYVKPPEPLDVLDQANRYAHDGDWGNYWECWTEQGHHKLVYWMAYEMRTAAEEEDRWRDQLEAWLPSFGLTLKDLSSFKEPPRDVRAYQATDRTRDMRRKIEQRGRSNKDFFVTAASWYQYDDQDWKAYQELPSKQEKLEKYGGLFSSQAEMNASAPKVFQFWPLCREDLKESTAKQTGLYLAVSYADMKQADKAEFPKRCYLRRELEPEEVEPEDEAVSEVPDDAIKTFEEYKDKEEALSVAFQNVNGVWLLDDFYGAGAASPAAKFIGDWIALNGDTIRAVDIRLHKAPDFVTVDLWLDEESDAGQEGENREEGDQLPSRLIGELSDFESANPEILNEILASEQGQAKFGQRQCTIRSTSFPDLLVLTRLADTLAATTGESDIYLWRKGAKLRNFFVQEGLSLSDARKCLVKYGNYKVIPRGDEVEQKSDNNTVVVRVLVPDERAADPTVGNKVPDLLRELPSRARLPQEKGSRVVLEFEKKTDAPTDGNTTQG